MASPFCQEQGCRPHQLAEQLIRHAQPYACTQSTPRSTPFLLYDTQVLTQRSHNYYRNKRSEITSRVVDDLIHFQNQLPPAQQEKHRKSQSYLADIRVAHQRPLKYKTADPQLIASSRHMC